MHLIMLSAALLVLTALPVSAQRIQDFGFTADLSTHDEGNASPQLAATTTLGIRGHDVELAVGSTSEDAFFSATRLWSLSLFTVGAGVAVYNGIGRTRPGLAASAALAVSIAPRGSAALQLVTRGLAVSGATRLSVGLGIKLAPLRGGLTLGEQVAQPHEQAEIARSWDAIVAQIMLLDNGVSSLEHVEAADSSLTLQFSAAGRPDLMKDVARVARILAASGEPLHLVIAAPEPVWISAAATSGGFPAERITIAPMADAVTTIRVLRAPVPLSHSVQP